MKKTLLDDITKIFRSINCDSLYCTCDECSKKFMCDLIENLISSISKFY